MAVNSLRTINLILPEDLISDSDRLAEQEGSSLTELDRTALHAYILRRRSLHAVLRIVENRGKAAGINTLEDVRAALNEMRTKP